ncbi:MAG: T9SS type A sorting domain-containing protein [Bacteroidetes bacterium]|nr:T9SS type A sorting domain-containing protein [Bacteroidota bacterium]
MKIFPKKSNWFYPLITLVILLLPFAVLAQFAEDMDTVEIYSDGFDIIYLLDDDSEEVVEKTMQNAKSDFINTSLTGHTDYTIAITLNNKMEVINPGIHGVNVTGMFDQSSMPEEDSTVGQWSSLVDLKPEILRFPSGANGKFMHVLSDRGYGYNLEEMIHYYDITDGSLNAPLYDSVVLHLDSIPYLEDFIDNNYVNQFQTLADKWLNQTALDSGDLYINSFLRLCKLIDSVNEGDSVKVLLCLNIFSEPADTCRKIVEYLRDNDIYNVQVAGVEIGNETYSKIFTDILGFTGFDDYYDYINGVDVSSEIDSLFPGTPMDGAHDYLQVFKGDTSFHVKVGVVAQPLEDKNLAFSVISGAGIYGEPMGPGILADSLWNEKLRTHFSDYITAYPGAIQVPAFDAVIAHTYYDTHHYDSLAYNHIDTLFYTCDTLDADTTDDYWLFNSFDARLKTAFDSIRINFRNFVKTGHNESIDAYNDLFDFSLAPTDSSKELWTSELNLNDANPRFTPEIQQVVSTFTNSFIHTAMYQEWWLQNLKVNFDSLYIANNNFYTIATWQNFVGGTAIDLMNPASDAELIYYDKFHSPFALATGNPNHRNYLVKRSTYYSMQLLGEINAKDLKIMKAKYTTYSRNMNSQPTTFITPDKQYIYIYFSNVRDTIQKYTVNPNPLKVGPSATFPGALTVKLDTATTYSVIADQIYATAGKSTLFDINHCYDDGNHPIIITGIDTLKDDDLILTVPSHSAGYIKARLVVTYPHGRKGEWLENEDLSIYPNPTGNFFVISGNIENELLNIEIYDMRGVLCKQQQGYLGEQIDVALLPSGLYTVVIKTQANEQVIKKLIKAN